MSGDEDLIMDNNKKEWVRPELEQIDMVDTSVILQECATTMMTGSKGMTAAEMPDTCSVAS